MTKLTDHLTRRALLASGAALATAAILPKAALAAAHGGDHMIESADGPINIIPIDHASLILKAPTITIYVDPVGDPSRYANQPPADLVLVTHEHGDHFNLDVLNAAAGESAPLVTNPAVYAKLPDALKARTTAIANGESTQQGGASIDAIPAYNTTADRVNYHPQGRDNGYVISVAGARIYVAGDTEDTPEMRALSDIDLAFVPMNLPYTMTVEQAASGVLAFAPKVVYPYHYRGSDTEAFKALVDAGGKAIEVRLHDWYA